MRIAAILVLAAAVTPAFACVNTFKTKILDYKSKGQQEQLAAEIGRLEFAFQDDPTVEHASDLAVGRLLAGRHADAIKLLEDAERRFPGSAVVAANLGTAYELTGRDAEALRWIQEGVRRDPTEHRGSEWLHVRILEAKIAMQGDPLWLEKHTVLGADFGTGKQPRMPASLPLDEKGRPRSALAVGEALNYQLEERTYFVKPPDAIVADLYVSLADLAYASAQSGDLKVMFVDPGSMYAQALEYGALNQDQVRARNRQFDSDYPGARWFDQFESLKIR